MYKPDEEGRAQAFCDRCSKKRALKNLVPQRGLMVCSPKAKCTCWGRKLTEAETLNLVDKIEGFPI